MTIAPITPDIFDVPTRITDVTRRMQQGAQFLGLDENSAQFLVRMINSFYRGTLYLSNIPAHRSIVGRAQKFDHVKESSRATVIAFRAAFGKRYNTAACKEKIRQVLASEVLKYEREKVSSVEIRTVMRFFEVWHQELEKLLVPA